MRLTMMLMLTPLAGRAAKDVDLPTEHDSRTVFFFFVMGLAMASVGIRNGSRS
jgi:hypothetical protein